jgi:hypothetical protein
VDIDPVVLKLGGIRNPDRPYSNPRVTLHNQDARAYLRQCHDQYDLVIFGTLDSHGLFSAMSSLKMENFVYTRDCFADAKALLSPDGVVVCTIGFDEEWVFVRLAETMRQVFAQTPDIYLGYNTLVSLVDGPGIKGVQPPKLQHFFRAPADMLDKKLDQWPQARIIPTDNWPHLFLLKPSIPAAYIEMFVVLIALSSAVVFSRSNIRKSFSPHFFLLGAGFMLLETSAITRLALTIGATWITSSIVIASILLVILIGNLVVLSGAPQNRGLYYLGLLLSLLLMYAVPIESIRSASLAVQVAACSLQAALPVLFAAVIFAISFSRSKVADAFASNLLGAVVGGFLEYIAMITGLRSLALVAIVLYGLSWAALKAEK